MGYSSSNLDGLPDELGIKLPKEYAKLKESEFPLTINGIEYKTKQELCDRYKSDLMAMAQLIYDIYRSHKTKKSTD